MVANVETLTRLALPGAAPYGFQGADFDFLMVRLLLFDPSRQFLGAAAALPPPFCSGRASARFFFSPLATSLVPGVSGDGREVSPTLKVSNHYAPNDRRHMNIRNHPVWPRFPRGNFSFPRTTSSRRR